MLCAKPCGKRLLLSPEKSSEGTLYSVPSFGGHIAISHDVTVYPFLVMARTADDEWKVSKMPCTKNRANKTKKMELLQTDCFLDWCTSNRWVEISNNNNKK